jgi:hypothetical protein
MTLKSILRQVKKELVGLIKKSTIIYSLTGIIFGGLVAQNLMYIPSAHAFDLGKLIGNLIKIKTTPLGMLTDKDIIDNGCNLISNGLSMVNVSVSFITATQINNTLGVYIQNFTTQYSNVLGEINQIIQRLQTEPETLTQPVISKYNEQLRKAIKDRTSTILSRLKSDILPLRGAVGNFAKKFIDVELDKLKAQIENSVNYAISYAEAQISGYMKNAIGRTIAKSKIIPTFTNIKNTVDSYLTLARGGVSGLTQLISQGFGRITKVGLKRNEKKCTFEFNGLVGKLIQKQSFDVPFLYQPVCNIKHKSLLVRADDKGNCNRIGF